MHAACVSTDQGTDRAQGKHFLLNSHENSKYGDLRILDMSTEENARPKSCEVMFYSVDKSEDLRPGHSVSDSSEGVLWRGNPRIYRGFCNKDQVVGTSKDDY